VYTARFLIIGTVTTLAIGLGAAPATAVTTDDTIVTFTVAAGNLSIAVPGTATIGGGASGTPTSSALGTITVTDGRGAADGSWTASVASTDFATGGGTATEKILKALIDYWSGGQTASTGDGAFAGGQAAVGNAQTLASSRTAFTRTGGTGNSTASWNPTLVFHTPLANVAGAYVGTVTHSVA